MSGRPGPTAGANLASMLSAPCSTLLPIHQQLRSHRDVHCGDVIVDWRGSARAQAHHGSLQGPGAEAPPLARLVDAAARRHRRLRHLQKRAQDRRLPAYELLISRSQGQLLSCPLFKGEPSSHVSGLCMER